MPARIIQVDVLTGETRSDRFLCVNPAGGVPFIVTPDGVGVSESNAMLWLLADGSPLMPQGALERAHCLQWMFFEQSKLEPFISPARFFRHIVPERGVGREAEIAGWQQRAEAGLAVLDRHLATRRFMLGDRYGITDIAVFGYGHVAAEAGIDMAQFPAIGAWTARVAGTPGFVPLSALCEDATAWPGSGSTD